MLEPIVLDVRQLVEWLVRWAGAAVGRVRRWMREVGRPDPWEW